MAPNPMFGYTVSGSSTTMYFTNYPRWEVNVWSRSPRPSFSEIRAAFWRQFKVAPCIPNPLSVLMRVTNALRLCGVVNIPRWKVGRWRAKT